MQQYSKIPTCHTIVGFNWHIVLTNNSCSYTSRGAKHIKLPYVVSINSTCDTIFNGNQPLHSGTAVTQRWKIMFTDTKNECAICCFFEESLLGGKSVWEIHGRKTNVIARGKLLQGGVVARGNTVYLYFDTHCYTKSLQVHKNITPFTFAQKIHLTHISDGAFGIVCIHVCISPIHYLNITVLTKVL